MITKADLILHNARIYTVDPARPWAEAVACAGGRIVAVGSNDEILALAGPETQVINAGGKLVLPGLTDAHVHFEDAIAVGTAKLRPRRRFLTALRTA